MQKDPFTMEIYRSLVLEKKFSTIIEFGSLYGSSAAWLSDISPLSEVISLDINQDLIADEFKKQKNLRFEFFDAFCPQNTLKNILETSKKPLLIIEDCHQNVNKLLEICYEFLEDGDYVIIEDTNPLGPARPIKDKTSKYVPFGDIKLEYAEEFGRKKNIYVDSFYCDRFGLNCSNQWNSFFCFTRI